MPNKPLTANEAQILRIYDKKKGPLSKKFTEEDLQLLQSEAVTRGEVSITLISRAQKVLEEHRQYMNRAPSRLELGQMCLLKMEFQNWLGESFFPVFEEYICLRQILTEKGIITDADLDAMVEKRQKEREDAAVEAFKNLPEDQKPPAPGNEEQSNDGTEIGDQTESIIVKP